VRRAAATLVLALLAWGLSSPGQHSAILAYFPKTQFGQILAGLVSSGALSVVLLFLAYALLTYVFGRFFCAFLCPLGAALDLLALLRRKARPRRFAFKPGALWRGFAPIAILLLLWAGVTLPFGLLEPYSLLAGKSLSPWLPSVTLAIVLVSGYLMGRAFCNSVCPAGFVLGLIARDSRFRLRLSEGCVSCGACERVCPASCVSVKDKALDPGRCVLCLECVSVCPNGSLGYAWAKRPLPRAASERRPFLAGLGLAAVIGAAYATPEHLRAGIIRERETYPVLPPGAMSLAHLNAHCTLCHTCVRACPNEALHPCPEPDPALWRKPVLIAAKGFCQYDCIECTLVCPTKALVSITVDEKHVFRLAQVRLKLDKCIVVTNRTSCGACAELCPTGAVYMDEGRVPNRPEPFLKEELCIGCGACQKSCPVAPMPAIWISGLKYQDMLAKRLERPEGPDEVLEDFPF
jgi:polyferredoxin